MSFDYIHQPAAECPLYKEYVVPYSERTVLVVAKKDLFEHDALCALPREEEGMIFSLLRTVIKVEGYLLERKYRQDPEGRPVSRIEKVPAVDRRKICRAIIDAGLTGLEGRVTFS